jgi:hypothetical protein
MGVVPELSSSLLVRTDERETRGTAVAKAALEEVLGAGDTGDCDRAVRAGDDVLEVLRLRDDRRIGESLEGETSEPDECVLLVDWFVWGLRHRM